MEKERKQGSAVTIINKEGKLLLQHRDESAPSDKNKWALWGGGKEGDESPMQTAIRELQEELSIDITEDQLTQLQKFTIIFPLNEKDVYVFELRDEGKFEYVLNEGDDLQFFSTREISSLELDRVAKPVLSNYLGIET